MKLVSPKPFTFEAGKRAVLLLHGLTGNSADVRMLGRFLEKHGYTSHAPIYRGHGVPPEDLLKYHPDDWWEDVLNAYKHLKSLGYEEIAVAGLSLGGVFSLKLGYSVPIKGIISMCAPMYIDNGRKLFNGVLSYAEEYKRFEGKSGEEIENEIDEFDKDKLKTLLEQNKHLVLEVKDHLDLIYSPIFIVQAVKDEMINPDSANIIFEKTASDQKSLKWYKESGHVITIDKEKEQLHEDVLDFLNGLDWEA